MDIYIDFEKIIFLKYSNYLINQSLKFMIDP